MAKIRDSMIVHTISHEENPVYHDQDDCPEVMKMNAEDALARNRCKVCAAKDAAEVKGTKMSIARIDRGSNPQGSVDCSIVATGCPFVAGRFGFSDRGRVQAEIRTDVSRFQCL